MTALFRRFFPLGLTLLALASSQAATPDSSPALATEKAPETLASSLENLGRIYQSKDNPFVQEFWLLGRYHGHYHWTDGSTGRYNDGFEDRRFRIGFQGKFFNKLTLHAQMVSGSDFDPFYNGFTELWAQWSFSDALNLTVGQQKHRFTHDRNVSSRYLNYLERGMLTNMFALDYTPAVTLSGKFGRWNYYTGLFSNATGPSMGNAFTKLNSGWSYIASITYDLQKALHTDTAHLNLSYLYSEAKTNATNLNRFHHGVSAALILTEGSTSLVTEATAGVGGTRGSAYGINFQPGYYLTDKLQVVARYQYAMAEQANGLSAQRRYEHTVGLNRGDVYQAGYLGLNSQIAAHRLKLMTGVEYASIGGQQSWTGWAGVRLFWGPHSKGPFPMAQSLPGAFGD